jgi:MFS family permease
MSVDPERAPTAADQLHAKRWLVLILLGVAQLMVTLDVTMVTIALPSAQKALHFSAENRQWAVTAYALSFGSLLLLGGKLGDLFARKWTFVAGLAGFAVASASAAWPSPSPCSSVRVRSRGCSARCLPPRRFRS